MTHRTTRLRAKSNDEIGLKPSSRLSKLSRYWKGRPLHSPTTTPSSLYLACQNNDLTLVESCLKEMKYEQIDYQHPPNNETALHIATQNQHKEMIQILLKYGARRSVTNADGQQAYELAKTKEIKDLFKRPQSFRFMFLHKLCKTIPSLDQQNKIKCKTCSLVNDDVFYEWELVDRNAALKSSRFRQEFKSSAPMNKKHLKQKLYSIKNGYIDTRLRDISTINNARVSDYFHRALLEEEPSYIISAYTICQQFSEVLNQDMARNVIHDLTNGCSKFSCDCLYSTEDGTKSIISIFLRHQKFQELSFIGKTYRGIVIPKHVLGHYKVDSCIITTTFLSTSKDLDVAQMFCNNQGSNEAKHSFFCTFEILDNNRSAIDISTVSEFKQEQEVLILPYSAFLITKIEQGEEITNIYLKQQRLTDIFISNGSQECSIERSVRLLELVGKSLLHNGNELLLEENQEI